MTDRTLDLANPIHSASYGWAKSQLQIVEKHTAAVLAATRASLDATREASKTLLDAVSSATKVDADS